MDDDQLLRYSRHIMLPELDIEGQMKLLSSRILIVGAGGLGCAAGLYLASSGVGAIAVSDFDRVELSNLQRQIGHFTKDINKDKTTSLIEKIKEINPDVATYALDKLSKAHLLDEIEKVDVVLDCSDNFFTRYLINEVCIEAKTALISGTVTAFTGQASLFAPHLGGPCYCCIYPEEPSQKDSCAMSGVIAPAAGIIGSIQALECLKFLLNIGTTLQGKLLTFNALNTTFQCYDVDKASKCKYCL